MLIFLMAKYKIIITKPLVTAIIYFNKWILCFLYFKLAKWSKQRIDARNTWTRSGFCAAEWDNVILNYPLKDFHCDSQLSCHHI